MQAEIADVSRYVHQIGLVNLVFQKTPGLFRDDFSENYSNNDIRTAWGELQGLYQHARKLGAPAIKEHDGRIRQYIGKTDDGIVSISMSYAPMMCLGTDIHKEKGHIEVFVSFATEERTTERAVEYQELHDIMKKLGFKITRLSGNAKDMVRV